jgi:tetratricopeptide (TPR) repeat protein
MTTLGRRYLLPSLLAAALLVIALRGGSYDDVARGETFFLAWWALGLGMAFGLLPRTRPSLAGQLAIASLIALGAWIAVGAIWSESIAKTLHEASRTLGLAAVFMLVVWTFGPRSWPRAAGAIAVAAVAVCCLALISRLAPSVLTSPLQEEGAARRLSYPFNYWNATGIWAAMTVGLALAWSAHAGRWWVRALALAGVCVAVAVAYLSYSRSAAVGIVIASVTVLALSRQRWLAAGNAVLAAVGSAALIATIRAKPEIAQGTGTLGRESVVLVLGVVLAGCAIATFASSGSGLERVRLAPRLARGALAAIAVVALIAAVAVGPALANEAWDSFHQPERLSADDDPAKRLTGLSGERIHLWNTALEAFRREPLRGGGAGTYEFMWNRADAWTHHVLDAHSLYLEALAETGLPGALLLIVALGAVLIAALRAPFGQRDAMSAGAAAGCAAALVTFCVTAGVDWMWESTAVAVAAMACAGVAVAARSRPADSRPRLPRAAAAILALVALALLAPALLAASEVRSSQRAVREGRTEHAVSAASVAISAEPWGSEGLLQRALVLEQEGFLDAAAMDARKAIDNEPANSEYWLILARIQAERGQAREAIVAARRARELNPRNPAFGS